MRMHKIINGGEIMEGTLMFYLGGLPYKMKAEKKCREKISGSGGMCKIFLLF